jgi:hypothetical protein
MYSNSYLRFLVSAVCIFDMDDLVSSALYGQSLPSAFLRIFMKLIGLTTWVLMGFSGQASVYSFLFN